MPEIRGEEILNKLDRQIEAQADLRFKIPSLVLIYPCDQHYLMASFAGQKWMLKLCCMAPGHEHIMQGDADAKESESNPALGWYHLDDLGELTGPIIKWMKSKESFLKMVSPRLGAMLEWVHENPVMTFLKEQGELVKDLKLPESSLPQGGNNLLPVSSEWIRMSGLDERDYRQVEGQGLVFLQKVLEKSPCGNLRPFYHRERMLWLCNEHWQQLDAGRKSNSPADTSRSTEEILDSYRCWLEGRVSKVRLLGDVKKHELTKVFVDLTIVEDRMRPSSLSKAEYWGLLDAVLRKLRNPFAKELEEELRRGRNKKANVKPDDLLRPRTRAVIVGAPGCGKSTLLRYLVYRTLQLGERLPVFLELKNVERADLERAENNLAELIFLRALPSSLYENETERKTLRKDFFDRLKVGRVSIFLDGLDEVSGTDFFKEIRQSFRDFLDTAEYQNNILILSTRPYALRDRFSRDEAQEMEIAPLNEEQVKQFIEHYYENDATAQKFVKEMRSRRVLQELTRVPALLGLLVHLYHEEGNVSEDKLELYHRMVDHLIHIWDEEKGAKREFRILNASRRRDFLKHLAFNNLITQEDREDSKRLVFTDEQILQEAQHYCHEQNLIINSDHLAEDVKATPLLREIGANAYTFAHLTVQEYLAAETLAEHHECEKLFCRAYFSNTLSEMEVLPMTLGLSKCVNELYETMEDLPDSLNYTNLRLRARGLWYAAHIHESHLTRLTDRFIAFVTKQNKKEERYVEIVRKAFSGTIGQSRKSIANRLLRLLQDEDSDVRQGAAATLGNFGGLEAIAHLQRALHDQDSSIRASAASALGDIGGAEAVAVLQIAMQDQDSLVRSRAANALGETGGSEAIAALQAALQDQDISVQSSAAQALGEIGGGEAVAVLQTAMQDQNSSVRACAAEGLGNIVRADAIGALQVALQDQNNYVRSSAAMALGKIGGAEAIAALQAALQDQDYMVRDSAAQALGEIGGSEAVAVLQTALQDQEWHFRFEVVWALGESRGAEAIPVLQTALQDQTNIVRSHVADALGKIGGAEAIAALQSALQDQNSSVRSKAADALGKIGGAEAIAALQSALQDQNSSVRSSAARALGEIGGAEAIAALRRLRQDKTKSVRELADDLIHNAEGKKAVRMLRISLSDDLEGEEHSLRFNPVEKLAGLEASSLVSGLQQALQNDDRQVRQRAASVIGYYAHDDQVIAQLTGLANDDPVPEVNDTARDALAKIARKRRYFGLES
jgi:HEAT repeat protein